MPPRYEVTLVLDALFLKKSTSGHLAIVNVEYVEMMILRLVFFQVSKLFDLTRILSCAGYVVSCILPTSTGDRTTRNRRVGCCLFLQGRQCWGSWRLGPKGCQQESTDGLCTASCLLLGSCTYQW